MRGLHGDRQGYQIAVFEEHGTEAKGANWPIKLTRLRSTRMAERPPSCEETVDVCNTIHRRYGSNIPVPGGV